MAAELEADWITGKNVYFLVRNSTGSIWNGSSFVAYATANLSTYAIAATEQGTASGFYTATFPAVSAGIYNVLAKQRAGGSPAESDVTAGMDSISWDGSAVVPVSDPWAVALPGSYGAGTAGHILGDLDALDIGELNTMALAYVGGAFVVSTMTGDVAGNVGGKVLGGGPDAIVGAGVWAFDDTGTNIATALLDLADGVEVSVTVRKALRAMAAALAGKVTVSGGTYAALANTGTTRLVVTDDGSGNRSVTPTL